MAESDDVTGTEGGSELDISQFSISTPFQKVPALDSVIRNICGGTPPDQVTGQTLKNTASLVGRLVWFASLHVTWYKWEKRNLSSILEEVIIPTADSKWKEMVLDAFDDPDVPSELEDVMDVFKTAPFTRQVMRSIGTYMSTPELRQQSYSRCLAQEGYRMLQGSDEARTECFDIIRQYGHATTARLEECEESFVHHIGDRFWSVPNEDVCPIAGFPRKNVGVGLSSLSVRTSFAIAA